MTTEQDGRYEWRPGARFSGDSEAIGRALDEIKQRQPLDGEAVVEAAAAPDSPLHHLMEWDDKKAAHLHRLDTGRRIMRSLQFVTVERGQEVRMPAYVNIPAEQSGGRGDYRHPWEPISIGEADRAFRQLSVQISGLRATVRLLEDSMGGRDLSAEWAGRRPKVAELRQLIDAAGEVAGEVTAAG